MNSRDRHKKPLPKRMMQTRKSRQKKPCVTFTKRRNIAKVPPRIQKWERTVHGLSAPIFVPAFFMLVHQIEGQYAKERAIKLQKFLRNL